MAAYNYKGYVIAELKGPPRVFKINGFYGTFDSVAAAKKAIDAKN